MFEKILLPLDGSELAEAAIPYVRDLAAQLEAEVYLMHACPPEHVAYLHMHQIYLNSMAEGLRKEIQERWQPPQGARVQAEVITGDAVKVILDFVRQKGIGLVAVTTHGTSGIRPWSMGHVAEKVVRGAGIPSLLIRLKGDRPVAPQKAQIQKILVPLDSSDASKIAVPYAIQLALKLKASVTIFSMAQTVYAQSFDGMGAGLGVNWDNIDAATEKYTDEYLLGVENEIKAAGVKVDHASYLGIDAAYEILEMEKKSQADLVVMATRGRSPIASWAFGSVAEKVLREGNRPILLVREAAA
ncbi:MAG: universal stress protein [Chloroflexi bacterium]|nr:universal stress protein [Chloroflexota bacterium]